jgi:4-hydroxy-tetrahydrodipicolinate reductase
MLKIALAGATGRMGLSLVRALASHPTLELVACGIRSGSESLARAHFEQAGLGFASELMVSDDVTLIGRADAVIDFTRPDYTLKLAKIISAEGKILISGTTGFAANEKEALIRAGERARIVWSANMSIGVTLLQRLVEQVSATLDADTDIEILEMHHRMKQDAPSGTALALGEAAARGRGVDLHDVWVKSRDGITGARAGGTIGFATLRGGDVVGDHTVIFAGSGERVELSHKASNREIYARGALRAALWAAKKPNGFYTMRDVVA